MLSQPTVFDTGLRIPGEPYSALVKVSIYRERERENVALGNTSRHVPLLSPLCHGKVGIDPSGDNDQQLSHMQLTIRSGGAYILSLTSLSASFFTSVNNLSPNPTYVSLVRIQGQVSSPVHNVDPPERTILLNSDFLRSRSVRLIESTMT